MTESMASKDAIYLCFKGVDYKAAVYVNYRFVGSHEGFLPPLNSRLQTLSVKGQCAAGCGGK
ncbi:MAG: hypothetical protein ACLR23_11100 [Clostridia bacterium]